MKEEKVYSKLVKVGERGQIVIPEKIRRAEGINSKSVLKILNYGTGTIILTKFRETKTPEENFFDILQKIKIPKDSWKQIQKERHKER